MSFACFLTRVSSLAPLIRATKRKRWEGGWNWEGTQREREKCSSRKRLHERCLYSPAKDSSFRGRRAQLAPSRTPCPTRVSVMLLAGEGAKWSHPRTSLETRAEKRDYPERGGCVHVSVCIYSPETPRVRAVCGPILSFSLNIPLAGVSLPVCSLFLLPPPRRQMDFD